MCAGPGTDGLLVTTVPSRGGSAWTTEDELTFLAHLGTWNVGRSGAPRRAWMLAYQATLPLKDEWGTMDREAIELYVTQALEDLPCP